MPATIVINGNTTLSTANAPGAYVNVQQPAPGGAATAAYGVGIVEGSTSWGPFNQLMYVSNVPSLYAACGPETSAAHDAVMECIEALSLNNNMAVLRVGDGSQAAASALLFDTTSVSGGTATAFYEGTEGDNISITMQTGTNSLTGAPTVTVTVSRAGVAPQSETYPNISAPSATGAFWTNLATAINSGIPGVRGPSALITFAAGTSAHGPALTTVALSGGANGGSGLTPAMLMGTDGTTGRTGAYAIRGSGATAFGIAGTVASPSYWPNLATLCSQEGILCIDAVPNGTSIATAITDRQANNATSDWLKLMTGDSWLQVTDATLGQIAVSPIGLMVGLRCMLAPSASTLNKPATGFGNSPFSQTSGWGTTYSQGQVAQIQNNGFDLISTFLQGYYSVTTGVVTSGKQDQYPVLTAYIARNIGAIANKFIGYTQSTQPNDPTQAQAKAAFQHFFSTISQYIDGTPTVIINNSNNTPTTIGEGFLVASVTVGYLGIVQQFVVNYTGAATYQIAAQQQSTTPTTL